jgi:hypothetical protein
MILAVTMAGAAWWSWQSEALSNSFHRSPGFNFTGSMSGILENVNRDIEKARGVTNAAPSRIILVDEKNRISEYSFSHETLWHNNRPLLSGVKAFHFEYRGRYGTLLTDANRELESVYTVTYVVQCRRNDKNLRLQQRIRLSGADSEPARRCVNRMFASVEADLFP